jgi:hypothetical protein
MEKTVVIWREKMSLGEKSGQLRKNLSFWREKRPGYQENGQLIATNGLKPHFIQHVPGD